MGKKRDLRLWKCQIRCFRESFSFFLNSPDALAQVYNFYIISWLMWIDLHHNDQKLSNCSFDDLIWLQNHQAYFRIGLFFCWNHPAHARFFDDPEVKEKLDSNVTYFFWPWEIPNLTQFEQERGGSVVGTLVCAW